MPTTYTHWRFGDECLKTLPKNLKELINNNRNIFDYGVHGPDFYFYYKCIKHNPVNDHGSNIHNLPAKEIFKTFKENYKKIKDKDLALSYILGFTSHFVLDSHSHSYVERAKEVTGFSHQRIESQLDKYLLIKDGLNPIKKDLTFSLKPTKKMAKVITNLYDHFDDKIVYQSMKDFVFYLKLLKDNSDLKRAFLVKLMKSVNAENFIGLLITKEEYKGIEPLMKRLEKLYIKALSHYRELALNVVGYINDQEKLNEYFDRNFNEVEDYKSIPVLTLEEEEKYIVDKF